MKKVFYQLGLQSLFIRAFLLFILSSSAYILVLAIIKLNIAMGLIGLFSFVFTFYTYLTVFYNRVIFLDNVIKVTGQLGKSSERIQFPDEILYSNIVDIRISYAKKNSRKKSFKSSDLGNLQPKLYFEFILNNTKTKWLCISTFSKNQRKEMLKIINLKTGKNFSYDEIEKMDKSIYKMVKIRKHKDK